MAYAGHCRIVFPLGCLRDEASDFPFCCMGRMYRVGLGLGNGLRQITHDTRGHGASKVGVLRGANG
jgi:hypothetical protein